MCCLLQNRFLYIQEIQSGNSKYKWAESLFYCFHPSWKTCCNLTPTLSLLMETLTHLLFSTGGEMSDKGNVKTENVTAADSRVRHLKITDLGQKNGWRWGWGYTVIFSWAPKERLLSQQFFGSSNLLPSGFTWPVLAPSLVCRPS